MTSSTMQRASATIAVCSALAALGGCASGEAARAVGGKAAQRPLAPAKIAQLGFGTAAHYAVCQPPACPTVTRKTLAVDISAAAATVTPAAWTEPTASPQAIQLPCPTPPTAESGRQRVGVRFAQHSRKRSAGACGSAADAGVTYIYFANNDDKLNMQAKSAIGELLQRAEVARSILVTGYTDSVGNPAANRRLAARRAAQVRDYFEFVTPGLADKTVVQAKGDCCFVATNAGGKGRSKNRRVELAFPSGARNAAGSGPARVPVGSGPGQAAPGGASASQSGPAMISSPSGTPALQR